jgi:spore coat protein H
VSRLRALALSLSFVCVAAAAIVAQSPSQPTALTAATLFDTDRIWDVHLTIDAADWSKLTPSATPPPPPVPRPASAAPAPPPAPMAIPDVLPLELLKQVLGGFTGPEGGRNGLSAQRGITFDFVRASFELGGQRFADVAVRAKGNGSFNAVARFPKPSLKVDLNKYVKGQKLDGLSTINLHNNIMDTSWINEVLAYRLYRDAGVAAPRTAYARVYVTMTGGDSRRYLGLYSLVENVDSNFVSSHLNATGGAIFKPVTIAPFRFLSRDWADYNQMYDPKDDLTTAQKERVFDFSDLLTNASDEVFRARIADFLDLDAFAKYMAVVVWLGNPDSILRQGQNFYVHLHPTTGRFVFIPWDQDHSFGQFVPWATPESQQQLDILQPWSSRFTGAPFASQVNNNLLTRTFALPAFRQKYLAELATIARTLTRPERLAAQVDELGAVLGPIVALEPKDGRVLSFAESLGEGTFPRPINTNVTNVAIKTFVKARQASVLAQLQALGVK